MTRPRSQLVSLDATPYYHCISRCVRRAFLCGEDHYSGKNFDHRKPWLVKRLALLAEVFAIDIAAYAVMRNHYHLVLHVDIHRAQSWNDDEVIRRWTRLYKGPALIRKFTAGLPLGSYEIESFKHEVAKLRLKLYSISKFMSCMNQYIACKANVEDHCTGRFWEGRFKSQALLDEAAVLSCMAYVDLNPIRAGLTSTLEKSDFTSVQDRIRQVVLSTSKSNKDFTGQIKPRLMSFAESHTESQVLASIPFNLQDYLELVDWTGRAIRPDKRSSIHKSTPKLLSKMGLSETQWKRLALDIQKQSITMLHGLDALSSLEKRAARTKVA